MEFFGMDPFEYDRIYKPDADTNTCCFLCKKCVGLCAWSADFKEIPGWKVKITETKARLNPEETGCKILFCPEFEEGDSSDPATWDDNGVLLFFENVLSKASEDFRSAYKDYLLAKKNFCIPGKVLMIKHCRRQWKMQG